MQSDASAKVSQQEAKAKQAEVIDAQESGQDQLAAAKTREDAIRCRLYRAIHKIRNRAKLS